MKEKPVTTPVLQPRPKSFLPILTILFLMIFIFHPGQLLASGFLIYNQDAKANGMATAATRP